MKSSNKNKTKSKKKKNENIILNKSFVDMIEHLIKKYNNKKLTKKQIEDITKIILEENEKSNNELLGGAFSFNDIGSFISNLASKVTGYFTRKGAPPAFRQFMEKYGNLQIKSIKACKEPVQAMVQDLLSVISLGKWDEQKDKYNFDSMYHVYFVLTTTDNRKIILEKNQVLNIGWFDEDPRSDPNYSCGVYDIERCEQIKRQRLCIDMPTPSKPIKLFDFFNNASSKVGNSIYQYDGKNNNCQVFLYNLLKYNNLLTDEFQKIFMQNTEAMVNELPTITQNFMKTATNLAGIADIILYGYGIDEKKTIKRKRKSKLLESGCLSCKK
jgi:hypothetical protein